MSLSLPSGIPTARWWLRQHQAALAIDELERAGYRVELEALPNADMPAVEHRVDAVFVTVRPPWYRRILFRERVASGRAVSLVLALGVTLERVSPEA